MFLAFLHTFFKLVFFVTGKHRIKALFLYISRQFAILPLYKEYANFGKCHYIIDI